MDVAKIMLGGEVRNGDKLEVCYITSITPSLLAQDGIHLPYRHLCFMKLQSTVEL